MFILDEDQKKCVNHHYGPVVITAGPGSGKTRVMSERIISMVKSGILPEKIVAISFTKASSIELKERTIVDSSCKRVLFGTFHSFFYKILRESGFKKRILDDKEAKDILFAFLKETGNARIASDSVLTKLLNNFSLKVNHEKFEKNKFRQSEIRKEIDFEEIFDYYVEKKEDLDVYDFDDLVLKAYDLLLSDKKIKEMWQEKYSHYLIDEFQDINKAQYEMIKILTEKHRNLAAVGDVDQSIYGFRGASPKFFLKFANDFHGAAELYLKSNYRSPKSVVDFSQRVISQNKERRSFDVNVNSKIDGKRDLKGFDSPKKEAVWIASEIEGLIEKGEEKREISVIYRVKSVAPIIASELKKKNIDYIIKDGIANPFKSRLFLDIKDYVEASFCENTNAVTSIVNKPNRYISVPESAKGMAYNDYFQEIKKSINKISYKDEYLRSLLIDLANIKKRETFSEFFKFLLKDIGYRRYVSEKIGEDEADEIISTISEFIIEDEHPIDFIKRGMLLMEEFEEIKNKENENKDAVILTTIHGSKGLEFNHVFVPGCEKNIIPYRKAISDEEIEEERRMFYVAITRAKDSLNMTYGNRAKDKKFTGFII